MQSNRITITVIITFIATMSTCACLGEVLARCIVLHPSNARPEQMIGPMHQQLLHLAVHAAHHCAEAKADAAWHANINHLHHASRSAEQSTLSLYLYQACSSYRLMSLQHLHHPADGEEGEGEGGGGRWI